ncbi:hypothetical protein [Nocardia sp. NPDC056000]|uniref:DMP19 family protein n=1 Tax=Nocardia sp. NPDC056000 TaxID=3345674 RepID=UPI0035E1C45C
MEYRLPASDRQRLLDLAAAGDIGEVAALAFVRNSSYPADWRSGRRGIPLDRITPPVGIVVLMSVFENEIRNGGYEQFLYNHPSELFYVPGTLRLLGHPELASACLSAAHHVHSTSQLPAWGGERPVLSGPREVFDGYFATERAALAEHAEPVSLCQVDDMFYRVADDLRRAIGDLVTQRIDDYVQPQ